MTRRFWTIAILLVIGLFVSATVLVPRVRQERSLGPVGVMMYFSDAVSLAGASGVSWQQGVGQLKAAGVTTLGMDPMDLNLLVAMGRASVLTSAGTGNPATAKPSHTYVFTTDRATAGLIAGAFKGKAAVSAQNGGQLIDIALAQSVTLTWPLGFSASLDNTLKSDGFSLVFRLTDHPEAAPFGDNIQLSTLPQGAAVLFGGPTVIGFPNNLQATAAALAQKQASIATIEFQAQPGLQTLMRALHYRGFRALGLKGAYVDTLTVPVAASKLVEGAQERKDRVLVLHPPGPTLQSVIPYAQDVSSGLQAYGLTSGAPQAQPYQGVGRVALLLISLAVVAGTFWLFMEAGWFTSWEAVLPWAMLALDVVLWFGLGTDRTRRLSALGAGLVFPALAMLRYLKKPPTESAPKVALRVLEAFGITLAGAFVATASLSSSPFYLDIEQFLGVKAVFILPLLLFTVFYWLRYGDETITLGRIWRTPIEVRHVVVGLVVILGLVIFIGRTGNTPIIGASQLQLAGRGALRHVFGVRPRTKEFLLGWPGLILGSYLLTTRWRWLAYFSLALGTIGLEDIVDTFAHLHIPFMLSLERTLLGAVIGWVIGAVLVVIARAIVRRWFPDRRRRETSSV